VRTKVLAAALRAAPAAPAAHGDVGREEKGNAVAQRLGIHARDRVMKNSRSTSFGFPVTVPDNFLVPECGTARKKIKPSERKNDAEMTDTFCCGG
jgi:hypothetical protein